MNRRWLLGLLFVALSHPAFAQVDLSGMWQTTPRNQDGSGMTGDTAGVPVSATGRWRADSWSPEDFDVAEWVCRPHSFDYGLEGGPVADARVVGSRQPTQRVIAWHAHANQEEQEITIWMDGRPHPPENTVHTWSGFSTGEWDGDVLVVTTTHVKEAYIRRTGLMRSDQTTVRTRWRRIGNYLQLTTILYDPVYLAEPYIRSSMMYVNDPAMRDGSVSMRRGDRDGGASAAGAAFPARSESVAGPQSEADGSVRDAARTEARRVGDDVSRVHREDARHSASRRL